MAGAVSRVKSARLRSTILSMLGGRCGRFSLMSRINVSRGRGAMARLCLRSKPMVELVLGFVPRDVADKQRIARHYQPGVLAAAGIGNGQRDMLRAVAGRMDDVQLGNTEAQFIAIFEVLVGICCLCLLMHINRRASAARNLTVARDVIGMVMRLDHGGYVHLSGRSQFEDIVHHIQAWIDHRAHARVRAANDVAGTAQVLFDDLLEVHRCTHLSKRIEWSWSSGSQKQGLHESIYLAQYYIIPLIHCETLAW